MFKFRTFSFSSELLSKIKFHACRILKNFGKLLEKNMLRFTIEKIFVQDSKTLQLLWTYSTVS
jgi:hypothetical protein